MNTVHSTTGVRRAHVCRWGCVLLTLWAMGCEKSPPAWSPVGTCSVRKAPPTSTSAPLQSNPFTVERLGEDTVENECLVVEDMDGDGHVDLLTVVKSYDPVLGLVGGAEIWWGMEGRRFVREKIQFPSGVTPTTGCTVGDIDNDGLLDVLMGTVERDVAALIQLSPRQFQPFGELLEMGDEPPENRTTTLILYDLDGKPPIDLIAGTFADVSNGACEDVVSADHDLGGGGDIVFDRPFPIPARIDCYQTVGGRYVPASPGLCPSGLAEHARGPVWAAHVADYNDDGRGDVVITGDYSENTVLMSGSSGGLKDATAASGIALYNHAMGLAVEDFDGDGIRDLYVSDTGPDQLWRGVGCGVFEDHSIPSEVGSITDRGYGWGVAAFDLEQDGDMDIFVSNSFVTGPGGWNSENLCKQYLPGDPPQTHFLLNNDGSGKFSNVQIPLEKPNSYLRSAVSVAHGDLDRDGKVDVALIENRQLSVYWNDASAQGHWISIVARDSALRPSFGARVVVTGASGAPRWRDLYGGQGRDGHSELTAHFGLGDEIGPVTIAIRWPDGLWSEVEDVGVNQRIVLTR